MYNQLDCSWRLRAPEGSVSVHPEERRLKPDQNLPCSHDVTSRSCGQRLSVGSKRHVQKTVIVTIFVHYKRGVGGGVKSLPALGRKNALLHKFKREMKVFWEGGEVNWFQRVRLQHELCLRKSLDCEPHTVAWSHACAIYQRWNLDPVMERGINAELTGSESRERSWNDEMLYWYVFL